MSAKNYQIPFIYVEAIASQWCGLFKIQYGLCGADSSDIKRPCCEPLLALFHCVGTGVCVLQMNLHSLLLSEDRMIIVNVRLLLLLCGHVSVCSWM